MVPTQPGMTWPDREARRGSLSALSYLPFVVGYQGPIPECLQQTVLFLAKRIVCREKWDLKVHFGQVVAYSFKASTREAEAG